MTALVLPAHTRSSEMVLAADRSRLFVAGFWLASQTSTYGHIGLFVPLGATKRAVVLGLRLILSGSSMIGNICRGADRTQWSGLVNMVNSSAKVNGANVSPVSLIRYENATAIDQGDYPLVTPFSAQTNYVSYFSEPLIVHPGQGVWFSSSLANTSFGFSALWREEDVV